MAKYGTAKYGTAKYGLDSNAVNYGGTILWLCYRTVNDLINDTDRAYINYTDLNRIEQRMYELKTILTDMNYPNTVTVKTDWVKQTSVSSSTANIPMKTQLDRIRDNLQSLYDCFYHYANTPQPIDTLENLTIEKANMIERILYDLHKIIKSIKKDNKLCGLAVCGGDFVW